MFNSKTNNSRKLQTPILEFLFLFFLRQNAKRPTPIRLKSKRDFRDIFKVSQKRLLGKGAFYPLLTFHNA